MTGSVGLLRCRYQHNGKDELEMVSQDIVDQIKERMEEISSECNANNPAYFDSDMVKDISKEINELQQKLWELES